MRSFVFAASVAISFAYLLPSTSGARPLDEVATSVPPSLIGSSAGRAPDGAFLLATPAAGGLRHESPDASSVAGTFVGNPS